MRIWLICALLLTGCRAEIRLGEFDEPQTLSYDFESGSQGWIAGFSDYNAQLAEGFNLQAGVRAMPAGFSGNGFYLAGTNQSDDLFMFIKSRFRGLRPTTRYRADIQINMLSNGGQNCVGVGGAPGESVYLKFGFAESEPAQVGYYLNADKGNQSQAGSQSILLGHVGVAGLGCDGTTFGRLQFTNTANQRLTFTTTEEGRIWFFIGIDSGFEGRSEIYIDSLSITVTPI